MALGGAYTAVEDNIVSALYNPASLNLYEREKKIRVTFFLNPIAPSTLIYEQLTNTSAIKSNDNDVNRIFKNSLLLVKGVVITAKFLDLGFIFNEQIIDQNTLLRQKNMFADTDIWNNCYHSVITRVKLAERVSLGGSGSVYFKSTGEKTIRDYGFSYGLLIKPAKKLNVGMVYHYMPQMMDDVRMPLEKLVDQTINVGLSYRPFTSTILSMDLRNLTEEKGKSMVEAHVGVEQRLFSLLALRAGFHDERVVPNRTISVGIGLIDSNLLFSQKNQFAQPHFLMNYSFVFRKEASEVFRYHLVTFSIRI